MPNFIKHNSRLLKILEQVLLEDASGLTLEFVVVEGDEKFPYRIRIYGKNLPYGNREIFINREGKIDGAGTHLGESPI
jgi:hypothetical protein